MNRHFMLSLLMLLTVVLPSAADGGFPRKVLLEQFTTCDCFHCPAGHNKIEAALSQVRASDVVRVCHHAGFTTRRDPYPVDDSEEYTWFYPAGGTFAPAFMVDRHAFEDDAPVMSVDQSTVINTLNERLSAEASVSVTIDSDYDSSTNWLFVTVSGQQSDEFSLTNPVLTVFLTEDSLVSYQNGASSKYRHDHVLRAVLTDTWGDAVSFDDDGYYQANYSYEIDQRWKVRHMHVIAFIGNYDSANKANCTVENTAEASLLEQQVSLSVLSLPADVERATAVYSPDGRLVGRGYKGLRIVCLPDGRRMKIMRN